MWQETFHQLSAKIATWIGDKTAGLQTADRAAQEALAQCFNQDIISHLLPYQSYDETHHLFINKKSVGFILELSPLTGATEATENILTNLLNDIIPANGDLQIVLWASDKIGHVLDDFVACRSRQGEQYQWLAEKRRDFLRSGTLTSLIENGQLLLRDFRLLLVYSQTSKTPEHLIEPLRQIRQDIQGLLKSIQVVSRDLPLENFLSFMADIVNPHPRPYVNTPDWNPLDPLNQQISSGDCRLTVQRDGLTFSQGKEDIAVRCYTIKKFPKQMAQFQMGENLGQFFNSALQIPCPFFISLHIRPLDYEASQARAQSNFLNKDSVAKSPLARFKPHAMQEYEDWHYTRQRLSEGDRLAKVFYNVVLYSTPAHVTQAERKLLDLYTANGWKLVKENGLQFPFWLSLLPMQMSEGYYQDLKLCGKLKTLTTFNAITLAPLQGEWKGTTQGNLLFVGRRGQISLWSPFINEGGNYNVAVAAASGRGKSVLTQEYIVAQVGAGGRVWVIDVGRSYEKTCRALKGEFIEFSLHHPICINPFTHIAAGQFDEELELLKPLTATMMRPLSQVSDEEMTWIEKALKAAWEARGNAATFTTVAEWLTQQPHPICKNLSHLLYSYTKDGMYARYFEGQCSINLDNGFVVLELEELKAKKDLQKIMLLVLMYQISGRMYLGDRKQQKSCIIDEAWDLLKGDNKATAEFIETGYRRARRYNANFITITQSINDYFKNPISLAAFENSDSMLILGQTTEAIEDLKKSKRLSIDETTEKVYKSLRSSTDFSEFVVKTPTGMAVNRLILDPYARILYSSKGEEFAAVNDLQKAGLSLQDAIARVAAKFQRQSAGDKR